MISIHRILSPFHPFRKKKVEDAYDGLSESQRYIRKLKGSLDSPTWDESYPERKAMVDRAFALDQYTVDANMKALKKMADRMNEGPKGPFGTTGSTGPG